MAYVDSEFFGSAYDVDSEFFGSAYEIKSAVLVILLRIHKEFNLK